MHKARHHVCGELSQFQIVASEHHLRAAKHVMRYLAATIDKQLTYKPDTTQPSVVNTDSLFADMTIQLHSTTGYIIWIYGCPILWRSKKQNVRVQSSKDAEYIAADTAITDSVWYTSFIQEIMKRTNTEIKMPFQLESDSQAVIQIIRKGTPTQGPTRIMQLKHHMIIDRYNEGYFTLQWIPGEVNAADIMTKLIKSKVLFEKHRD